MPLLGALLGHCWASLLGCHGRVPLLGASMVGYQLWWLGAISVCHGRVGDRIWNE